MISSKGIIAFVVLVIVAGCASYLQTSPDIDRGRYLVEIMGCNDCHTPGYMNGGTYIPEDEWLVGDTRGFHGSWGTAYPTNLRLMLSSMSEDEWLALARKMRKESPMAWVMLSKVNDEDLRAVYRFVQYLGPKGAPAPSRLPPGMIPSTEYINFPEPH